MMDYIWFHCSNVACDSTIRLRLEMRVPRGDLPVLGPCPVCKTLAVASSLVLGGRIELPLEDKRDPVQATSAKQTAVDDFLASNGEVVRRLDLERAAGGDPSVATWWGVDRAKEALAGNLAALDEFHEEAGLALPRVTEHIARDAVRLYRDGRAVFSVVNEGEAAVIDAAELVAWILSSDGQASLKRRGVTVPTVPTTSVPTPTITSRIIPPYNAVGWTCPLGFSMQQNRHAVPTWSYAMECYPPARIIEIGSYNGGFATAIGVHAQQIGARVVSYDVAKAPHELIASLAQFLGIEFRTVDVWTVEKEIGQLIASPGVTFVLCDGGNKRRELATFAQYLKPGDVIAAHDYVSPGGVWWGWSEITAEDGAEAAATYGLEPWLQDHFDTAGWLVFRRCQDAKQS